MADTLSGKVVLITGGSRGLGLVLARRCMEAGARVAVCARDERELRRAREQLRAGGRDLLTVTCDLSQPEQIRTMLESVLWRLGPVDVLINNAGVIQVGPMETMTLQDYEESMAVHYWAPLHTVLGVLPEMRLRRRGRIVNICSVGGKIALPHLLPYCASKFALAGLSQGLRAELAGAGISVTTVYPGLMRTGSPRNAFFKGRHQSEYAWFSISDSLPLMTMSAERAAAQILRACLCGDPEVVLTAPAWIGTKVHGLFPGLVVRMIGVANRFLPGPGGIGSWRARGSESESALAPSRWTALSDQAARKNNEIPVDEPEYHPRKPRP